METDTLDTFMNGEIPAELPTGWHRTFTEMVCALKDFLEVNGIPARKMYFLQVKEKFGEMRIYTSFADEVPADVRDTCHKIVNQYCCKTADICWQCGGRAIYRSKDWILPWCNACSDQHASERERPKEILFTKISR